MNHLSNLSAASAQPKVFSPPKLFTAKRFVETKNMTQAEWLDVRRQGIGSSDCTAACGLNPYMSMLELWMIKTGRIKQSIEDESEGHAPLYWGKRLEPLVAEYYSMHTNYKVRRVNGHLVFALTGLLRMLSDSALSHWLGNIRHNGSWRVTSKVASTISIMTGY